MNRFQVREYPGNQWNVVDTLTSQFVLPVFVSMEYSAAVVCGALNNEIRRAEQMRIPLLTTEDVKKLQLNIYPEYQREPTAADYLQYVNDPIDPRD